MNSQDNRVAIIAIHGVADQKPTETVRRIADLLLGLKRDHVAYQAFTQADVRVPVRRVTFDRLAAKSERSLASAFRVDPRAQCMKWIHRRASGQSISAALAEHCPTEVEGRLAADSGALSLDYVYMQEQLSQYEPADQDRLYECARLAGSRTGPGKNRCEVHIYELFWADLSRLGTGLLRMLVEFYQLLFHLCGLGGRSLDFARAHHPDDLRWKFFSAARYCAEQLLTLAVPVLNLCLLGLGSVLLPLHVPIFARTAAIATSSALVAGILVGWAFYTLRFKMNPDFWPWGILVVLLGVMGGALASGFCAGNTTDLLRSLVLMTWLVFVGLILWLMQVYQRRKPGAAVAGLSAVTGVSLIYLVMLWTSAETDVLNAALQTAEWTLLWLTVCWLMFALACLATSVTGFLAVRGVKDPAEREPSRRVAWTVQITLFLPGLVVALMNLVLWKALYLAGQKMVPTTGHTPIFLLANLPEFANWTDSTRDFVGRLIDTAASPFFVVGILAGFLAVLLSLWSLIPVVLSEFQRAPRNSDQTVWLGRCLSRSFLVMRLSGEMLRVMAIVGLPVAISLTWLNWHQLRDTEWVAWLKPFAPWLLTLFGSVVVLVLSGSKGPFAWLALGFRAALDVALDVVNWLRLHPADSNPKARITTRFVSLLRYLCNWQGPGDAGGYKAMIIIAHSQGTVIAADVLRFLRIANRDPQLEKLGRDIPVYLFTVGCPLRQLYGLRFPHDYGWARCDSPNWPSPKPDPATLGVKLWVNAYRSGDYVGRYLWHPDTGTDPWLTREEKVDRVEFCIGGGAHNRYWDDSAPEIAAELDRLIETAGASGGTSRA